jgi:hypothetical protein
MRGLNIVLLIYMGLSFCEVVEGWVTLQVENSFVLLVVQIFFVLSMLVHDASFINVKKTCCHTKQLMQWFNLMLRGLVG